MKAVISKMSGATGLACVAAAVGSAAALPTRLYMVPLTLLVLSLPLLVVCILTYEEV